MDERINETYRKIGAELFRIILFGSAISLVVKTLFLNQNLYSCITEYLILVCSPIYMAVRSHMLGVTQLGYLNKKKQHKKRTLISCICAIVTFVIVYSLMAMKRGEGLDGAEIGVSVFAFAVSFVGFQLLYRHLEAKRQEKLDRQYEED